MKVAKGYKQTELGVIPEDWEVKSFSDFASIFVARDLKTNNYSLVESDKFPYPVYSNTVDKQGLYGYYDFAEYNGESLTIVGRGAGLGTAFQRSGGYGAIGRLLVIFTNKNTKAKFVSEYFNSRIKLFQESGGIPQLTGVSLSKYKIAFPPTIEEQNAITNALNETDALIGDLEKLIAKKQNIKQATMQVLLTGKKRLKGFKGEWKKVTLKQIGDTYGGLSGKTKKDFENGKFAFITFMNVMKNPVIDTTIFEMVNLSAGENQNKVQKGDLLFNGSSETPEEVGMCSVLLKDYPDLYLNSFCFGFRLKKELKNDALFLSYYFRSKQGRKLFYSLAQGATRYNLSKSNFLQLEISLPEPEEQKELASLFLDIDNEIEALQQQLSKYRLMKEGMMQDLLTGKVRLI